MNVGSYYAGPGAPGHAVFPPADRLYGSHDDPVKPDLNPCPGAAGPGYSATAGFDTHLPGYQGQLQHQPYTPFDAQYYVPCRQTSTYAGPPPPGSLAHSRYLHDANKFAAVSDSIVACAGNDVMSQYGGRHLGTAAMMAAAAMQASIGGQHQGSVGPSTCPTLPIYPWMRSVATGMQRRRCNIVRHKYFLYTIQYRALASRSAGRGFESHPLL